MQIIEQALIPKNPTKKSEDGIVVSDDFIAVIDGSTSKSTRRCNKGFNIFGRSNGEIAMRLVSSYIRRMPKTTTCHQFCIGTTRLFRQHYKSSLLPHLAAHPEDRMAASAVVFSRLRREIWMVGDCQCLVGDEYFDNPKPYEQPLAEMRAAKVKELLAAGVPQADLLQPHDPAREVMIPTMLDVMKNQNITYAVIDGFPIPEQKVKVIPLDFQKWEIVFASDGYPQLAPTLKESESLLAHQRETDPLNIGQFKATKAFVQGNNSFDDRTYIRFEV